MRSHVLLWLPVLGLARLYRRRTRASEEKGGNMHKPSLLALIAPSSIVLWACAKDWVGPKGAPGPASILASRFTDDRTLVVDDDGTDCLDAEFTSIQAAVTAAAPGNEILVCAGTYHEQVTSK